MAKNKLVLRMITLIARRTCNSKPSKVYRLLQILLIIGVDIEPCMRRLVCFVHGHNLSWLLS